MEEYYENARDYIRDAATAKAIFVCSSDDLMGYFSLRPETTYIQVWHGCGVFKKIGLSTIDQKWGKSAASHKEYPINKNYSYVTIASPELAWIFEEAMGIDKESGVIVPTGVSRTDIFFDDEYIQKYIQYDSADASRTMAELVFRESDCGMPVVNYCNNLEKKRNILYLSLIHISLKVLVIIFYAFWPLIPLTTCLLYTSQQINKDWKTYRNR